MLKIHYLRVSDYDAVTDAELAGKVCEETLAATESFRCAKVRRLKWIGEGMIRDLLENELRIQRGTYRIVRAEHGKPYVEGTPFPVFYNLSHSGDYVVCGLSDREVGVDVQQVGKYRGELVRRFFHPREIRQLEQCAEEMRSDLFFRYWSAKESYLKYTGTGLSASLSGFEVRFEKQGIRVVSQDSLKPIYLSECALDNNYKCFVCSECPEVPEIIPFAFDGR